MPTARQRQPLCRPAAPPPHATLNTYPMHAPHPGKALLLCLFLLLSAATLTAQTPTAVGDTGRTLLPASAPTWAVQPQLFAQRPCDTLTLRRLYFGVDVSSFLRNAEYAMPFTVGFTSINYRIAPTLSYAINDRATLSGGFLFDGIVGSDSLIRLFPLFRFEYQATPWVRVVLGSLYGGLSHGLDWPLYDYERHFFSYYFHPEAGVQLLTRTARWQSDTWIDWEHYLNPWTYDQERFTMASHHEIRWTGQPDSTATLAVTTPLTFMVAHRGGQFSLTDTNNGSLLNLHAGLAAQLFLAGGRRWLRAYLPVYYYKNISGADTRYGAEEAYHTSFRNGWGLYPQLALHQPLGHRADAPASQWLDLTLGYWHGHHYLSPRGSLLYQSATWKTGDTTGYALRNMLTLSATVEHHYRQLALGIDLQLFYDLSLRRADYAYGIYLRWALQHRVNRQR